MKRKQGEETVIGMPVQNQSAGVIIGLLALYVAGMSVVSVLTAAGEEIGWRGVLLLCFGANGQNYPQGSLTLQRYENDDAPPVNL